MDIDFAAIATTMLAQATDAVTASLPVVGAVLGVTIGFAIFKRFAKGK